MSCDVGEATESLENELCLRTERYLVFILLVAVFIGLFVVNLVFSTDIL